ncbi:hypothetical protein PXK56_18290 [Phaeobacter gallaeciensis]|uniref:hypothetical protein n=1 Tax=Phaeobacter gallaeciensis TaxID=60890 RepID=UPI002380218B|nr:hypothetical protein [Phaeobacter gallaeciensis]MDE4297137.1 hypothetical protein [Phaeobacter gallaeciensis]
MTKAIKLKFETVEKKSVRKGASGCLVAAKRVSKGGFTHSNREEAIRRIADDAEKRLKGSMRLLA